MAAEHAGSSGGQQLKREATAQQRLKRRRIYIATLFDTTCLIAPGLACCSSLAADMLQMARRIEVQ